MSFSSLPRFGDALLGRIVELRAEDDADGVAHRQHAADAPGRPSPAPSRSRIPRPGGSPAARRGSRKRRPSRPRCRCRRGLLSGGGRARSGSVLRAAQMFSGSDEMACCRQVRRQLARQRRLAVAVHRALQPHLPEHHLRMAREIFVDGDSAVRGINGSQVPPRFPSARRGLAPAFAGTEYRS